MSFYQTQNLPNFVKKSPLDVQDRLNKFLQDGFHQPQEEVINTSVQHMITGKEMLSGFITRLGLTVSTTDFTDTAENIIADIKNRLKSDSNSQYTTIRNGFWFDFAVYNDTEETLYINGNSGVAIGFIPSVEIPAFKTVWLRLCVTDVDPMSPEIYISILN